MLSDGVLEFCNLLLMWCQLFALKAKPDVKVIENSIIIHSTYQHQFGLRAWQERTLKTLLTSNATWVKHLLLIKRKGFRRFKSYFTFERRRRKWGTNEVDCINPWLQFLGIARLKREYFSSGNCSCKNESFDLTWNRYSDWSDVCSRNTCCFLV